MMLCHPARIGCVVPNLAPATCRRSAAVRLSRIGTLCHNRWENRLAWGRYVDLVMFGCFAVGCGRYVAVGGYRDKNL